MRDPASTSRAPARIVPWFLALGAVHVALSLGALAAWIHGPFRGAGIIDGYEMLQLAQTGSAGPFETKSPLYPWLLGLALELTHEVPWTVGALGLALSLGLLAGIARLCCVLGEPRAAPWAMGLYVISGVAYAYTVQPLEPVLAALALVWGAVLLAEAESKRSPARALVAGALLSASVFARAPLSLAVLALLAHAVVKRRFALASQALVGAALVALACFVGFGARAWPTGSAFNLRLGNGASRSGIPDVRPGPAYERARYEAAFAPVDERGEPPAFEAYHLRALRREIAADPAGAALTLLRKAALFWHRTEIVTSADFRHGLRDFAPFAILIASFGLVAPLALASLRRARSAFLWLPVAGVFAANALFMTSARYRFPALPFLCAAAALWIVARKDRLDLALAAVLALLVNVNLSGRALLVPGDGWVQEGHLLLSQDLRSERAREVLREAVRIGSDPRAHYDLALSCERSASSAPGLIDEAEAHYREALRLDPLYPQAAENLVALLFASRRFDEAIAAARELRARIPYAGKVWLNLAAIQRQLNPGLDTRETEAEGFRALSLVALSQNDLERARLHAREARTRGLDDPRMPPDAPQTRAPLRN